MPSPILPVLQMRDVDLAAAAEAALQAGKPADLVDIGGELERRSMFALAWQCLGEGARLRKPGPLPAWRGPGSPGTTLLVRRKICHLGAELRPLK